MLLLMPLLLLPPLLLQTRKPQSVTLLIRQGDNGGLMFMIDRRPTQAPKHYTKQTGKPATNCDAVYP